MSVQEFLNSVGASRKLVKFEKNETIFLQDDPAENVFYIQAGSVRLSVVSGLGKSAVIAILWRGDFFGEGCIAGQRLRISTATVMKAVTLLVINKSEMIRVLRIDPSVSDCFIAFMLSRNLRIEEDLIAQFLDSTEKRLARALLMLSHRDQDGSPPEAIPMIPQETLAEIVGATRPHVNVFLNKFRKMGFIKYDDQLVINTDLLIAFLND